MNQLMSFALCVLASRAVLDVWFLGSIFAWHRAWAELLRDEGKWWLTQKFGELMTCRFCFSYHSSLWLSLFCLPTIPWWAFVPWWLAVRTTTSLLDKLFPYEEESNGSVAGGENNISVSDNDGSSFFG